MPMRLYVHKSYTNFGTCAYICAYICKYLAFWWRKYIWNEFSVSNLANICVVLQFSTRLVLDRAERRKNGNYLCIKLYSSIHNTQYTYNIIWWRFGGTISIDACLNTDFEANKSELDNNKLFPLAFLVPIIVVVVFLLLFFLSLHCLPKEGGKGTFLWIYCQKCVGLAPLVILKDLFEHLELWGVVQVIRQWRH